MQVETDEGHKSVELSGFDELAEAVSYLLSADHVLISEAVGAGKEFGTIRIRCRGMAVTPNFGVTRQPYNNAVKLIYCTWRLCIN